MVQAGNRTIAGVCIRDGHISQRTDGERRHPALIHFNCLWHWPCHLSTKNNFSCILVPPFLSNLDTTVRLIFPNHYFHYVISFPKNLQWLPSSYYFQNYLVWLSRPLIIWPHQIDSTIFSSLLLILPPPLLPHLAKTSCPPQTCLFVSVFLLVCKALTLPQLI